MPPQVDDFPFRDLHRARQPVHVAGCGRVWPNDARGVGEYPKALPARPIGLLDAIWASLAATASRSWERFRFATNRFGLVR